MKVEDADALIFDVVFWILNSRTSTSGWIYLSEFKIENFSKHHFNCPQNVIQKFPPFVSSLPTSADDAKIVKISCPNFDLFKNFSFVLKLFLQINCYFTVKNTVNCNYTKCSSTFEVFGCKLFQSTTISQYKFLEKSKKYWKK